MNGSKPFQRGVTEALVKDLTSHPLFRQKLLPDIQGPRQQRCRVFPAIRHNRVDFYHRGGKLFSFDRQGFRTNLKHAASFHGAKKLSREIRQGDLALLEPIKDFISGYEDIKTLCALYSDLEPKGVSGLYARYGFSSGESPVVVLDVEASFDGTSAPSEDDVERRQNRVDIVLFEIATRALTFVEAKRYQNPELYSSNEQAPPIVSQINRYRWHVEHQRDEILSAYTTYIEDVRRIFGLEYPTPTSIDDNVMLLVFEYDGKQEEAVREWKQTVDKHVCCESIGHLPPKKSSTLTKWVRNLRAWKSN